MERGIYEQPTLPHEELEELVGFHEARSRAYDQLNKAELELQQYGDVEDLVGESIVERYNTNRLAVRALTAVGIERNWLSRELVEN